MHGRSKLFRTAPVINKCLKLGKSCHSSVENPPVATVTFTRASKDWHRFPSLHPTSLPSPPFTTPSVTPAQSGFLLVPWPTGHVLPLVPLQRSLFSSWNVRLWGSHLAHSLPYRLRVFDQKLPSGNALSIHPRNCNQSISTPAPPNSLPSLFLFTSLSSITLSTRWHLLYLFLWSFSLHCNVSTIRARIILLFQSLLSKKSSAPWTVPTYHELPINSCPMN